MDHHEDWSATGPHGPSVIEKRSRAAEFKDPLDAVGDQDPDDPLLREGMRDTPESSRRPLARPLLIATLRNTSSLPEGSSIHAPDDSQAPGMRPTRDVRLESQQVPSIAFQVSLWLQEVSQLFLINAWPYCVYATLSVGRAIRYPSASARKLLATTVTNTFLYVSLVALGLCLISWTAYHAFLVVGYAVLGVIYSNHYRKFSSALSLMPLSSNALLLRGVFFLALVSICMQLVANVISLWDER